MENFSNYDFPASAKLFWKKYKRVYEKTDRLLYWVINQFWSTYMQSNALNYACNRFSAIFYHLPTIFSS